MKIKNKKKRRRKRRRRRRRRETSSESSPISPHNREEYARIPAFS
jgi:hypothetical protein